MQLCTTKAQIRALVADWRRAGESVALVPTGGGLHAGHMALTRRARAEATRCLVSIIASPARPGPTDASAPTPPDAPESAPADARTDLAMLRDAGVDAVFLPDMPEIHPPGAQTIVETTELARMLLGKHYPGHFRAVATGLTRLFNITRPDCACFGEKDYQQLAVIRQMVRDLDLDIAIHGVPTQREADGLALSSRNTRLAPQDRAAAPVIARALFQAADMAKTGITASRLRAWVAAHIGAEPRARVHSVDIRDAETLDTIAGPLARPAVILAAVRFGAVLLIDQRIVFP